MVRSGCHSPHAAPAASQLVSSLAQAHERAHYQASGLEKSRYEVRRPLGGGSSSGKLLIQIALAIPNADLIKLAFESFFKCQQFITKRSH